MTLNLMGDQRFQKSACHDPGFCTWHLQIGLSLTLLQFLFVSLVLQLFLSPPYSLWRVHLLGLPCLVTFIFVSFDLSSLVLVSTSVFKLPVLF